MDFILNGLGMLGMIILSARQAQIPPELVLAIIETESGGNPYAVRMHPTYAYTMPQAKKPAACTLDTELYLQRSSLGLMQIMGATARSVGFDGWLPELFQPALNVQVGVGHLSSLMSKYRNKHGVNGVIAAYNAGSPRKRPDGKFVNQGYVDKVLKAMEKYEPVVKEKEEAAVAGALVAPVADEADAEVDLDKMTKSELLEYAKAHDIAVDSKAKIDEIRDAIRASGVLDRTGDRGELSPPIP
ncbi:MAG: transglycosylase SLT domain-containing protein [Synergistaceae bacterium]|jgi:hypothetical protein|nr:transglycosylase SLT domain-containing protein [Synergistaceae bacterium]